MVEPRFYRPPGIESGQALDLPERELHHALHVLRLKEGATVVVLDGCGLRRRCRVTQATRQSLRLETLQTERIPRPPFAVTLFQAVTKPKSMDWIVQKATELGVHRLVPLLSEHVVNHRELRHAKAAKWHWTAVDALKQSNQTWLPILDPPTPLDQLLPRLEAFELALLPSLSSRTPPRSCFEDFARQHGRPPRTLALWVGPEGDFTADELNSIERSGSIPVTLGDQVLRAETAAVFCLSFIYYELLGTRS